MGVRSAAGPSTPKPGGATGELRTPVLSARRAAAALSEVASVVRLRAGAAAAVSGRGAHTCLAIDGGSESLFASHTEQALTPASNLKLFTAYAALEKLGGDTRFTTEVKADRPPVAGVVDGNLYLVGSGDPLLQTGEYNTALKDDGLPT